MKNNIPLYTGTIYPDINLKYSSKIYLTLRPNGDILITDTEKHLQTTTSVPTNATLIDIIQTVEDCLPIKPYTDSED